jgi:hypothetical protein
LSVGGITKAAMACLKDLDSVFHKHRDELVKVKVKDWRNGFEEKPLGE